MRDRLRGGADRRARKRRSIEHKRTLYRGRPRSCAGDPVALLAGSRVAGACPARATARAHPGLLPSRSTRQRQADEADADDARNEGGYVQSSERRRWWIPSGRIFDRRSPSRRRRRSWPRRRSTSTCRAASATPFGHRLTRRVRRARPATVRSPTDPLGNTIAAEKTTASCSRR